MSEQKKSEEEPKTAEENKNDDNTPMVTQE